MPLRPRSLRSSVLQAGIGLALALCSAASARAAETPCDGESPVRLSIVVDKVAEARGEMVATVYPDDRRRFLAHHGQVAGLRRASEAPSTTLCVRLPAPGRYEAVVYQDLNGDRRFNRNLLGMPKEPYGLSNDPPNLLGLPSFPSVQFEVHAGDNAIHIPLHRAPG